MHASERPLSSQPAHTIPAEVEFRLAPDERWWAGVAQLVLDRAHASAAPLGGARDLRSVTVLVPAIRDAQPLRTALYAALGCAAFVGPNIATLEQWAGATANLPLVRRTDIFAALRENGWVRERFGDQAGGLWSLVRDIETLSDELTLAACGEVEAFEDRWRVAVQRNFSRRAAAAGDAQARLVLALWRAALAHDGGAAQLRRHLQARAQRARGPLIWLAPRGALPWQVNYCRAYRAGAPIASASPASPPETAPAATLVVPDMPAFAQAHPWLGGAWPELMREEAPEAIAVRARAMQDAGPPPPLQILRCDTLEAEAVAAARWTVERLESGCAAVALIALDRLTARRVRALLERAAILVADEAGWKLSTTSAAAAVMRWVDLVAGDFSYRDLLDWLRSPFTLHGLAGKDAVVAIVESALRAEGVLAGVAATRRALARHAQREPEAGAAALRVIEQLEALARAWQGPAALGRYLGLLQATLEQLGMRAALEADSVGQVVLTALQQLHDALIGSGLRLELAEFRALLAHSFEEHSTGERSLRSPVLMTTLAATRLRRFDAALLIGADADRLPARGSSAGLLAGAVRQELGLPSDAQRLSEQGLDLAALLALTPCVAATWRYRRDEEPRPLSPLLERLAMLIDLAGHRSPIASPIPNDAQADAQIAAWSSVAAPPDRRAAPRAPAAPGRLPARVSASAYQDLIDCPYRFFGLRVLGLREADMAPALPSKRDFGTLLHQVLLEFHRGEDHRGKEGGADPGKASQRLRDIIDACVEPLLSQRPALIGYRERLRALVPGYLQWLAQRRAEGWHWLAGEAAFERSVELPGGERVGLFGRIDRIDADGQGQRQLLDYKARDADSLRRGLRDAGEDVQLLFYGLLLDPPAHAAAYLSVQRPTDPERPAHGVVKMVDGPEPYAANVDALLDRLVRDLARIGAGAPLVANGAETVCARCELRSLCRHGFA